MLLRGTLSQDWPKYLPEVTKALNNTPIKTLGWLKPSSIHGESDSQKVRIAKQSANISTYTEPSFQKQEENQHQYENSSNTLQVNDFVYLDFDEKLFDKSFDVSVSSNVLLHIFIKTKLSFLSKFVYKIIA